MTRRRRIGTKAILLALTVVAVGFLPTLSLSAFLYVVGAVLLGIGSVLIGMALGAVEVGRRPRAVLPREGSR